MKVAPLNKEEKDYYRDIYGFTSSPDMKSRTLALAYRMANRYKSLSFSRQLTYFANRNEDYAVVIPSRNVVADKFNAIKDVDGTTVIELEIDGVITFCDISSVYIVRRERAVATYEPTPIEYNGKMASGLVFKTKEETTMKIQTAMTAEEKDFYIRQHSGRYKSNPISNGDSKLIEFHKQYGVNAIVSQHQIDKHDVNVHYAVVNIRKNVVADEIVGIGGRYSGRDGEGYYRTGVGVKVNGEIEKLLSCDIFVTERDYEKPPVTTFNGLKIGSISLGAYESPHTIVIDSFSQMHEKHVEDNSVKAELGKVRNSLDELESFLESMGLKTDKPEVKGGSITSHNKSGLTTIIKANNDWISTMGLNGDTAHALIDGNTVTTVGGNLTWKKRSDEINNNLYSGLKLDNVEQLKATSPIDTVTGILHKALRKAINKRRPTLLNLMEYKGIITQDELDVCMLMAIKMLMDNPEGLPRNPFFAMVQPHSNPVPSLEFNTLGDQRKYLVNLSARDLLAETLSRSGLWSTRNFLRGRDYMHITTHANYYINETKTYGDNIMFGVKF